MSISCPSCYSDDITFCGNIPSINSIAGSKEGNLLPDGSLYQCKVCNLYFRWPRISKVELDRLYKEANQSNWQYEPQNRIDWKLAADWLKEKFGQGTILEIGCWDGKFLNHLGDNFQRYAIEINEVAIRKAEARGACIVEKNIDKLDQVQLRFDAIVAFDFIEHTENSKHFLKEIASLLHDKGFIVISSGNTEAITWKISGSRYWYCSNPEHISFINIDWCYFVADSLNLQVEYFEKFSHAGKKSLIQSTVDVIKNVTYLIAPNFFGKLRRLKNYYLDKNITDVYNHPPSWATSKDHLFVIFKKKK